MINKPAQCRALSTGTPEVNNYPFTTRGMTMVSLPHHTKTVECPKRVASHYYFPLLTMALVILPPFLLPIYNGGIFESQGHVLQRETGCCYQMMDTPGLLSRPDEKRNEMECLTLVPAASLPLAFLIYFKFKRDHASLAG